MQALVLAPIAPLMTEPKAECELADEALHGMTVTLGEERDGYIHVTTDYRYSGWAPRASLLAGEARVAAWAAQPRQWVIRGSLDVLAQPRVQAWPLITLPRGAQVTVKGPTEGGWAPVELADGRQGYCRASGLRPMAQGERSEAQLRAALVADARLYLGAQYRWGGKTAWGIDCSGLCSMCYLLEGVAIYRDAAIKPDFPLRAIPREQIAPGDLILFPGHVAMYLGEGRYIHSTAATGSDGVVINSLRPEDPDFRADLLASITEIGSIF